MGITKAGNTKFPKLQSEELHRKMDTIIVEELHLTKLALMMFSV